MNDVALDSRHLLPSVIALLLGAVRVLDALGVHDAEAGLLFPTIASPGRANQFFLRLAPEWTLAPGQAARSIAGNTCSRCPNWGSPQGASATGTRFSRDRAPHRKHRTSPRCGAWSGGGPTHPFYGRSIPAWAGEPSCAAPFYGRSIPAWAGEPSCAAANVTPLTVYPRVGGGTPLCPKSKPGAYGLSPRGRGNQHSPTPALGQERSIPAWAGEPAYRPAYPAHCYGLSPRGRGNPIGRSTIQGIAPVYPRVGGGTIRRGRAIPTADGSIPAWAGEPYSREWPGGHNRVYPRVGGGTFIASVVDNGLSPRGPKN